MFRDSPSTPAKAATAHNNNITVFCFHGIKLTCLEILLPLQLKQLQNTVTTITVFCFHGIKLLSAFTATKSSFLLICLEILHSTPAKAATAHSNNITVFCFHGIKLICLEIFLPFQLKQQQNTVTTSQFSAFTGSSTSLEILLPLQLKQLQHTVTTSQFSAFTGSSLHVWRFSFHSS